MDGDNHNGRQLYYREWREWRGLSQTQLAKIMGVSVSTVNRIESGKRDCPVSYVYDFGAVLGVIPGLILMLAPTLTPCPKVTKQELAKLMDLHRTPRVRAVQKDVRKALEQAGRGRRPGVKKSS